MPCGEGRPCYRLSCIRHFWWFWFCEKGRRGRQGAKFAKMTDEEILDFVDALPYTCEIDLVKAPHPYGNSPGVTLNNIALAAGITRERVRQIEAQALENLGRNWRLMHLEDFRETYHTETDPYFTMYPDSF